jgi:nickel/cobalt transporter (NiCoT) family protein
MYTERVKQNIAIAISTDVYDHIDGVGEVGGIIGK